MRARPAEPGCRGENQRALFTIRSGPELSELGHRRLVHMAADDELGAGFGEGGQHVAAPSQRTLAGGAPGRGRKMMVEGHYP